MRSMMGCNDRRRYQVENLIVVGVGGYPKGTLTGEDPRSELQQRVGVRGREGIQFD